MTLAQNFRSIDFQVDSDEGLPIRGTLVRPEPARAVVVIVHGFKGFRQWGFFPWLCEAFGSRGIAACRFDMSRNGVGESAEQFDRLDLFADDTYSTQLADLRAVNAWIDDEEDIATLPRFVLGHSRGGAIAVLGASELSHLRGVVTWASISSVDRWDDHTKKQWVRNGFYDVTNQRTGQVMRMSTALLEDCAENASRLDVLQAARLLRIPLMAVHGDNDESVGPEDSRAIVEAARDSSLVIIRDTGHTFGAIHPLVHIPSSLQLAFEVTERFVSAHSMRRLRG
jgi:dienelactone hydrolase